MVAKIKRDRFFIGKSKWKMTHEQYIEYLKQLKELYHKIMMHKNEIMQTEKWKQFKDYFYINIQDTYFIQLKRRRQHIYRKLGAIIYKKFNGEIPKGIGISVLKYHPKAENNNKKIKNKKGNNKNVYKK